MLKMQQPLHATTVLCCSVPRGMARYNDARSGALPLPPQMAIVVTQTELICAVYLIDWNEWIAGIAWSDLTGLTDLCWLDWLDWFDRLDWLGRLD